MRPLADRSRLIHAGLLLFAVAVVGRAAKVQLLDHSEWRARAKDRQVDMTTLPAARGAIREAGGEVLVESREMVRLNIAPPEVKDRARLGRLLAAVGVKADWVRRVNDPAVKWVEIPGLFVPTEIEAIVATNGVHPVPVMNRVAPPSEGLRRIIGRAQDGGAPVDGIELALDALLRGQAGEAARLKDSKGRLFASPGVEGAAATPGRSVTLTINAGLQDIAERSLTDAVRKMGADGGDIVILDPHTGEVRALASHRADPLSTGVTALTEAYEPGSTLKPFVAAALLDRKRARVDEVIDVHGGRWTLDGRVIEDDHKAARFTLAEVIQFSSNIGIVQLAARLSAREQFEVLRDAGLGAPTGITYPTESPGRLYPPSQWSSRSPASLAMGYEVMVTPMQLAAAYAAIANGGELLQPALVKEIRAADGTVEYRHERRVVRRVMSEATARTMRVLLKSVVDGGTAEGTSLATFEVAGKTGTAKVAEHGRYLTGVYKASFVGMFPADDPQIVILVKLDNPRKSIYGGKAAAPVTKTILEAAIAARDAALDRRGLANAPQRAAANQPATPRVADAEVPPAGTTLVTESAGSVPVEISLEHTARPARIVAGSRAVPNVRGLSSRAAARALHRAGFRVGFSRGIHGTSGAQWPAAGVMAPAGSRVTVELTK